MTPAFICAAAEVAVNRTLRLEPEVLADLARLNGRVLGLSLTGLGWQFYAEVIPGGVRVAPSWPSPADVEVQGSPLALARMAAGLARGDSHLPDGVQVEGDLELLQRFMRLLARVGLTPEELAAKVMGDVAATKLVSGVKALFGWGGNSAKTVVSNASEYLREESYSLARADDVNEWSGQVRRFSDSLARLEARLKLLEAPAAPPAVPPQ